MSTSSIFYSLSFSIFFMPAAIRYTEDNFERIHVLKGTTMVMSMNVSTGNQHSTLINYNWNTKKFQYKIC